jgi:hypothetical protein
MKATALARADLIDQFLLCLPVLEPNFGFGGKYEGNCSSHNDLINGFWLTYSGTKF